MRPSFQPARCQRTASSDADLRIGLLLIAVAGVLAPIALFRAGVPWAWTGVVFAAGLVFVLPQFFTPPATRTAHGVLFGVGCILVAFAVTRIRSRTR
jgi:hypothetical protein